MIKAAHAGLASVTPVLARNRLKIAILGAALFPLPFPLALMTLMGLFGVGGHAVAVGGVGIALGFLAIMGGVAALLYLGLTAFLRWRGVNPLPWWPPDAGRDRQDAASGPRSEGEP